MNTIISIRVKKEIKKLMTSVKIDWRKKIEEFIRRRTLEEMRRKILLRASKNVKLMKEIDNVAIIREKREYE